MSEPGLVVRGPVLRLAVAPGERVALTSRSGSVASATLAELAGHRPSTSCPELDGSPLVHPSPSLVGYVGYDHLLVPTLTAAENLVAVLLGEPEPPTALWRRAEQQLDELGLGPLSWHHLVEQLSGGQQQRVALGRALVARPRLLVLDDPTSELDPDSALRVLEVLDRATAVGACCVLTSSDPAVRDSCDRQLAI